jgi:hypothetical protein
VQFVPVQADRDAGQQPVIHIITTENIIESDVISQDIPATSEQDDLERNGERPSIPCEVVRMQQFL